jgi:hypothetical protein
MKKLFSQHSKHERGQSLVELSISMTLIVFLLAGAFDIGNAFIAYVELRDAVQEGALYGSINPIVDTNGNGLYDSGEPVNVDQIRARVRGASTAPIDLSDPSLIPDSDIRVNIIGSQPCEGNGIEVTILYDYKVTFPFFSGSILNLKSTVTDTILSPVCP